MDKPNDDDDDEAHTSGKSDSSDSWWIKESLTVMAWANLRANLQTPIAGNFPALQSVAPANTHNLHYIDNNNRKARQKKGKKKKVPSGKNSVTTRHALNYFYCLTHAPQIWPTLAGVFFLSFFYWKGNILGAGEWWNLPADANQSVKCSFGRNFIDAPNTL